MERLTPEQLQALRDHLVSLRFKAEISSDENPVLIVERNSMCDNTLCKDLWEGDAYKFTQDLAADFVETTHSKMLRIFASKCDTNHYWDMYLTPLS